MSTTQMTTIDKANILAKFTNKDDAGRHYIERYDADVIDTLEAEGFIAIDRPIHERTGIPYDQQYWTAEVTPLGVEFVDDHYDPRDDDFNE